MHVSLEHLRTNSPPHAHAPHASAAPPVQVPQYSWPAVVVVWAAASLPMAALAWLLAPLVAARLPGQGAVPMAQALSACLALGLVWQFVLVVMLVVREQGSLRWATVRDALWLRPPRSPRSGRVGGRVWFVLVPLILAFAATSLLVPSLPVPAERDLGALLASEEGANFLSGNWTFFALMTVVWVFNSVLGEELLFRGFLLPRMNGAFGRWDWVANGVLFAVYHLHMPWTIPGSLLDTFTVAYPARRYRSAWIGIAVHSAQTVFFAVIVLALVI